MSPKEQRIAIANACGWTVHHAGKYVSYRGSALCDPLSDLNVIHEAERHAGDHLMDADQWEEYGHALERMHPHACLKTPNEEKVDYYDFATLMVELTAAQRVEAFLKTLGLWKDDASNLGTVASTTAQPSSKNES